ncbi:MAG: alpha/beta hydrolase [Clostridium sp.]|uniref:alpha/beta hydrolase n=1 Tax=Clostridium sp. TaxID=1506 RepID=UPI002906331E|nr:alpha/beta hydrolase [Clostridium sp.]MDU5110877.1 alpha/beta hydrolase [Clostridium sp.]
MDKREYFINFGMDEDVVEMVKDKLDDIKVTGNLKGELDNKMYYEIYKINEDRGGIVISHGFTECIEKYREFIYYLTREGYSVYIMEHRGHGRSGELGTLHKSQVNVENFNYYVDDLKIFIDEVVVKRNEDKDLFLFGHSMGGAISAMFIEKYNDYFKKAILSSPMLKIAVGSVPSFLAIILSKILIIFGKGDNFIFGNMPYESTYDFTLASTSNESRYNIYYREVLANENLQRGGGSFKWLYESLIAIKYILKKKNISKIKIPILLFQAGKDELVGERGIKKFVKLCKTAKLIYYKNAKHELYLENNDILEDYLDKIFDFLQDIQ